MSTVRLSAEALARLLAAASRYGFELQVKTLILGNPVASATYQQLGQLREHTRQRVTWDHLAEVLAAVDALVQQLADWPLPLVRRDVRQQPLALLAAATQLRCVECGPKALPRFTELHRRLVEQVARQAAKLPAAPPADSNQERATRMRSEAKIEAVPLGRLDA